MNSEFALEPCMKLKNSEKEYEHGLADMVEDILHPSSDPGDEYMPNLSKAQCEFGMEQLKEGSASSARRDHAFFGHISIIYDDKDCSTYEAVKIYTRDAEGNQLHNKLFATGDANYDYHCAILWMEEAGCGVISRSSSCDHFEMDGGVLNLEVPGMRERLREYIQPIQSSALTYIK